ncbi:MAG: hypothetical protein HWE16_17975 [Gammaproteobacteria bacterium]|nr:hypothetical protein [Gammaproteobacteria bacterium]
MLIAIENRTQKQYLNRLKALMSSYPVSVQLMAAEKEAELYFLDVALDEDQLPDFAQDAKFGFSNELKVERVLQEHEQSYQTEFFVDLDIQDINEEQLLELRERFCDANIEFNAIEFNCANDQAQARAYASSDQAQAQIAQFIS